MYSVLGSIQMHPEWFLDDGTHYGSIARMCFKIWLLFDCLAITHELLYKGLRGRAIQDAIERKY